MTQATEDKRFGFGENWRRFLAEINEARIAQAVESLRVMLNVGTLQGKRVLDAGSGSGLFSLAARRLGGEVVSFDYDANSVACTEELRRRYDGDGALWRVEQGSVLDARYLQGLGQFDIVYSWGVLHHTGAMWRALELIQERLAPHGTLFIALYNDQGLISRYWLAVKRIYNAGLAGRYAMIALHAPYLLGLRWLIRTLRSKGQIERGMTYWYDMLDWLGGYPFEVAAPGEIETFFSRRGLMLTRSKLCGTRHGCNEYVFESRPQ